MSGLRPINFLRFLRVVTAPFIALNLVFGVLNAVAGQAVALVSFAAMLLLVGVAGLQTYAIRRLEKEAGVRGSLPVALMRRATRRPRMTPEDYRHLREMETELGWEPSEPLMPASKPVQPARRTTLPVESDECSRCGHGYLAHSGGLCVPCSRHVKRTPTEDRTAARRVMLSPVEAEAERERYRREIIPAEHFAQLARGRQEVLHLPLPHMRGTGVSADQTVSGESATRARCRHRVVPRATSRSGGTSP